MSASLGHGLLTVAQAAAIAGVVPSTWRAYVARGQAPQPVGHLSRTPLWDRRTVQEWQDTRANRKKTK